MTTLVYGPYPPTPGAPSAATLALVRSLVSEGHQVVVISPTPSAAHHHLDVGGATGAASLLRMTGDITRAIVRLDATGLQAGADGPRLRLARAVLGRALRRIPEVELHLDRVPSNPNPRWVTAVVGAADTVVVESEDERRALVAAGQPDATIRLAAQVAPTARQRGPALPPWTGTTRATLQRDVRRRAAAARAGSGSAGSGAGPAAAGLREIPPLALTPIQSAKPGVVHVKRLIRRLVAWQLDPIIQHLNRLHRASIASVEQLDAQDSTRSARATAVDRNERSEA